jgi:hypothetical protein
MALEDDVLALFAGDPGRLADPYPRQQRAVQPRGRAQLAAWYLAGEPRQEAALVPDPDGAGTAFVDLIRGRRHGRTTVSTGVA